MIFARRECPNHCLLPSYAEEALPGIRTSHDGEQRERAFLGSRLDLCRLFQSQDLRMRRKSYPDLKDKEIAERTAPSGYIIYQTIFGGGEHELSRRSTSLPLSGLAAGLSMGCSFLSEA